MFIAVVGASLATAGTAVIERAAAGDGRWFIFVAAAVVVLSLLRLLWSSTPPEEQAESLPGGRRPYL